VCLYLRRSTLSDVRSPARRVPSRRGQLILTLTLQSYEIKPSITLSRNMPLKLDAETLCATSERVRACKMHGLVVIARTCDIKDRGNMRHLFRPRCHSGKLHVDGMNAAFNAGLINTYYRSLPLFSFFFFCYDCLMKLLHVQVCERREDIAARIQADAMLQSEWIPRFSA